MPMGKKKYKGESSSKDNSKIVMKGKKTFPSRYNDGLASEDKIVMKEKPTFSSRYK